MSILLTLVGIGVTALVAGSAAYESGKTDGKSEGYNSGRNAGFKSGEQNGFRKGKRVGSRQGYGAAKKEAQQKRSRFR